MSCSTPRQVIRSEQTREVNKDVQSQLDSLVRSTMREEMERVLNSITETETDLIVFDTDKPVNDSTGLPPVKAVVRQRAKTEQTETETGKQLVQVETEVTQVTEDHSTEQTATAVEEEQKASWWETLKQQLMRILLIPVLFIALWVLYKLIKLLK